MTEELIIKKMILDPALALGRETFVDQKLPTRPIRIMGKTHHAAAAATITLGSVALKGSETWKIGVVDIGCGTPAWFILSGSGGSPKAYQGTLFQHYIPGFGAEYSHHKVTDPYKSPQSIFQGPGSVFARVIDAGSTYDYGCHFEGPAD